MQVLFSIFIVYVLSQIVTFYTFEGICSMLYVFLTLLLSLRAAAKMRDLAQQKGHNVYFLHVLGWCFWFPIFGYLYVIALPDLTLQKQNEEIINLLKNQSTQQQLHSHEEKLKNAIKQNQEDSDSWTCPKCGERNPKTRMTCQKCDTYKNAHM